MKIVKIQALKARKGKKQHMIAGKVYNVEGDTSKSLIKNGKAIAAAPEMEEGKVYELPESEAAKDFKDDIEKKNKE